MLIRELWYKLRAIVNDTVHEGGITVDVCGSGLCHMTEEGKRISIDTRFHKVCKSLAVGT